MARPRRYAEPMKTQGIRLSDKHAFALRLICRTGDAPSVSTVLGELIEQRAGKLSLGRDWQELWDPTPGVAIVRAYGLHDYRPEQGERSRYALVCALWQFFYHDQARTSPIRENIVILWPKIDLLAEIWEKTRTTDYWATANEMAKGLREAKLPVPLYGSAASPESRPRAVSSGRSDIASRSLPGKGGRNK